MGNVKNIVVFFATCLLAYTFAGYTLNVKVNEIKKQIQMEMYASLFYQGSAHYFESSEQALHGFAKYFYDQSLEEKKHADKLMTYLNKRNVTTTNLIDMTIGCNLARSLCTKIEKGFDKTKIQDVITLALKLEKAFFVNFENIVKDCSDAQLVHFIEHEYLDEQIQSIKELSDFSSQITRISGNCVGVLLLDRWLLEGKKNTEL